MLANGTGFARRGTRNGAFRHGRHGTPEYRLWAALVQRCTNRNREDFATYGGRGITVCTGWRSFENFFASMGKRPVGMTVERNENASGYWCGTCEECRRLGRAPNCRWATREEQARNTSRSRLIEARGERLTLTEWSRRLGIPRTTLRDMLVRQADKLIELLETA